MAHKPTKHKKTSQIGSHRLAGVHHRQAVHTKPRKLFQVGCVA